MLTFRNDRVEWIKARFWVDTTLINKSNVKPKLIRPLELEGVAGSNTSRQNKYLLETPLFTVHSAVTLPTERSKSSFTELLNWNKWSLHKYISIWLVLRTKSIIESEWVACSLPLIWNSHKFPTCLVKWCELKVLSFWDGPQLRVWFDSCQQIVSI